MSCVTMTTILRSSSQTCSRCPAARTASSNRASKTARRAEGTAAAWTARAPATRTAGCPSESCCGSLIGRVADADQFEIVSRGRSARLRRVGLPAFSPPRVRRCRAPSARAAATATETPRRDRRRARSPPCRRSRTPPSVARCRPAMIDSTVDFPQPEWPRMHTNSPSWIMALTFSTATSGPVGRRERLGQAGQLERDRIGFTSRSRSVALSRLRQRRRRPEAAGGRSATLPRPPRLAVDAAGADAPA